MYHCAFIECYLTQIKHKLIHFLFTVPSAWQHTGCHCLGDKELPPNPGIALGSFPSKQGSSSLLWKHTYTDNADSSSALTKRPDVKAKEKENSHILLTRMTLLQKYMFSPQKIQKNKLYFENTFKNSYSSGLLFGQQPRGHSMLGKSLWPLCACYTHGTSNHPPLPQRIMDHQRLTPAHLHVVG